MFHGNKKIIKSTTLILFIALIFVCRGGSLGMIFSGLVTNMQMSGEMMVKMASSDKHNNKMSCCVIELPFAGMSHDFAIIFFSVSSVATTGLLFFSFLLIYFSFSTLLRFASAGYYYLKKIRSRYGSWRYFNFISCLFSRGLLHPKTW